MVGIRIAPDNSDVIVWKLDESGAPFVNSSTSPSALSHAVSDLATKSGTILMQQPSPFAASGTNSCVAFTATNSGSPRNFISGANNAEINFPITISYWFYLRSYNNSGFVQHVVNKQDTTGVWSGPFGVVTMQNTSTGASTYLFLISTVGAQGSRQNFTLPLNNWSHIGCTYDGSTLNTFLNGNLVDTYSGSGNTFWGNHGPWFIGAIPSGSGNPEESACSVCDIRVANVARNQAYFQNIYQNGILNSATTISVVSTLYKLRAYDIFFTTTPVYWTDTSVSFANAPASPSGLGYGPLEIMETWTILNS